MKVVLCLSDQHPKKLNPKRMFLFHGRGSMRLPVTGACVRRVDQSSRRLDSRLKHKHLLTWVHAAPSCVEHLMASFVISCFVSVNVEWWMNIGEILIHPDFRLRGRSVMLIASLQRSPLVEAGRVETWSPLTSSADPDVTFTLIPVFLFCNTTCKRHREIKPLLLVGRFYPACLRVTCLLLDVGSITEKIAWIPLL